MPHSIRAQARLVSEIKRHGLEPYLEFTHALVGLFEPGGALAAANSALRALIKSQARSTTIRDLVVPSLREDAQRLVQAASQERLTARGVLAFGSEQYEIRCECLVIGLMDGGFLLFAEPTTERPDLLSVNEQLEANLLAARSALDAKTEELQAVIAQADEMAHTDALTFLPNRRMIIADLQRQVMYSERYGTPLTVSMLDLDDFKSVNDVAGHAAGDKVLQIIARELRDHIRQPDEIGRYGGDELLVVLPNSTAAAAGEQAGRLCQQVRSTPIPFGGAEFRLTLSIGIAQLKTQGDDWQTLLQRADRALYEAKRAGGDQWVILQA